MNIKNIAVYNMYNAIEGIRNSYSNKERSDSEYVTKHITGKVDYFNFCHIGGLDLKLILTLCKKRPSERKFLRQIFVSMDIKGSIAFWKQLDTYKVGTVSNSESTMHTLGNKRLTQEDFERPIDEFHLDFLNNNIDDWQRTKDKQCWEIIENNLPISFLQSRLWTANYEVLLNIYLDRKGHKKPEWEYFCNIIKSLELLKVIIEEVEK